MAKKKTTRYDKEKEEERAEERSKITTTAFFLMFPCFILAGMAVLYSPGLPGGLLAIALSIYQFFMLKKFIEDYYKR